MKGKNFLLKLGEFGEKFFVLLFEIYKASRTLNINKKADIIYGLGNKLDKIKVKYYKKRIYQTLQKFEKEGFIIVNRTKKGSYKISFTKKGRLFAKLKKITGNFKKYKKYTKGKKRIVFFDIPERFRSYRNALRNFLRLIGYKEVQKSVFISEYDNFEDLEIIVTSLGIDEHIKTGLFEESKIKYPLD
ncbi:MAG: hypothetical protein K6357_06375 [Elusimicrobiota bacterium]